MVRYFLPKGMRYSSLGERDTFYRLEFDFDQVKKWFKSSGRMGKVIFAAVIGRHTRIFPPKYKDDISTTILFDEYKNFNEIFDFLLDFLPESLYYDRNLYEDGEIVGMEIAFDLDPENLICPLHGSLDEKMKRGQGLGFCETALDMVKNSAIKLYEELSKTFSHLGIIYSGRGFHIHIFDNDSFSWSYKKRKDLADTVLGKGFPIDEWVTSGGARLIRVPFSLHGMVSRIVYPLRIDELANFNPIEDPRTKPSFLKD